MRKKILLMAFLAGFLALLSASSTYALGLKVAPLEYRTELKKGERQKGFIDISNPSGQTMVVEVSVRAFKQINDDGGLRFYDDAHVEAGIVPELDRFELGPREAIRAYFTIDGAKLPDGDVYAAVFFSTAPAQAKSGVGQQVRVGTLLSIVNRTPGERKAIVSALDIPFFQADDSIRGTYSIMNTGDHDGGFYPDVIISAWPSNEKVRKKSGLVFGGHTRENPFTFEAGFGIRRVTVSYGSSSRSQWVVALPAWAALGGAVLMVAALTELVLWYRHRIKA